MYKMNGKQISELLIKITSVDKAKECLDRNTRLQHSPYEGGCLILIVSRRIWSHMRIKYNLFNESATYKLQTRMKTKNNINNPPKILA